MEKFPIKKVLNIVWTPLGSRFKIWNKHSDIVPFFVTGVVYIGSKYTAGVVDTGGKFIAGINDTSGTGDKLTTGDIDTSGAPSPKIFEKILNEPNVIFRDLGEDDSGKKPEQKIL